MNQPNSPLTATRTQTHSESPDILAAMRRYVWLLISGAVAGAAVSGGLYTYFRKYQPEYTARVKFQVSAPPPQIGAGNADSNVTLSADDTSQLIHRQMDLFAYDPFLTEIISDPDFRKDANNPSRDNQWMRDNGTDLKRLRKFLVVDPKVSSATFDLTMTARDPMDAFYMVKAAKKVYLAYLQTQSLLYKDARRNNLSDALKAAETDYKRSSDDLALYADTNGIDVEKSRFEIEKTALQQLNQLGSQATAEAQAADALYQALQEQIASAKKSDEEHPDPQGLIHWYDNVKLSPDMEQYMENDMTLRQLEDSKLGLLQERAGIKETGTMSTSQRFKEIDGRIAEIDRQITETKNTLRRDNVSRMAERAKNEAEGKKQLASQYATMQHTEEDLVRTLGKSLQEYQQKVDDLKEKYDLLTKMRLQNQLAEANKYSDDTRVQPVGDQITVPSEVSWPKWYVFLPLGTAAGLGLSALLAYLLVLTDTRVRTPRDISRTLQFPMLGFVPDEQDDRSLTSDVETAILSSPLSMVAESFRQIRSHINAQTAHAPVNTLLVASITPGGGATTVAANLAAAMALNEMRVLLVDANFYRPRLAQIFRGMPAEGLIESIQNLGGVTGSIVPHPTLPRLHLLNCGQCGDGASSEKFTSKPFRELMDQLKSQYDLIIFDGAPLNLVSDSLALASQVDGVVPVVRAGDVTRGAVSRVREQLRGVHANLLGFVLNAAQTSNTGYFKENYRSFYRYAVKNGSRTASSN